MNSRRTDPGDDAQEAAAAATEALPSVRRNNETEGKERSPLEKGESVADAPASPLLPFLEGRRRPPIWPSALSFVGTCIDSHHPTLLGRVKVYEGEPTPAGGLDPQSWWLPTLHGLTIRVGDRLLVQHVAGSSEPIVVGVIDGFIPRPEPLHFSGPQLEIKRDEALRVNSEDGHALLEIVRGETGAIVRLLQSDTRLDFPGKLSITAAELELKASSGSVRIEASDEVALVGETVQLN